MKLIGEAIRTVAVSYECLFVLVVFIVQYFAPGFFRFLGNAIMGDSEVIKWIPAIPLALCAFCFTLAWRLTTPLDGSNKELFDWPDYWRLKMRRNLSLAFSILCAGGACGLWIFSKLLTHDWVGFVFVIVLGVTVINTGCMAYASFTIREILEQNPEDHNKTE